MREVPHTTSRVRRTQPTGDAGLQCEHARGPTAGSSLRSSGARSVFVLASAAKCASSISLTPMASGNARRRYGVAELEAGSLPH